MVELNKFEDALVNMGFVKDEIDSTTHSFIYNGLNMITIHHENNQIFLEPFISFYDEGKMFCNYIVGNGTQNYYDIPELHKFKFVKLDRNRKGFITGIKVPFTMRINEENYNDLLDFITINILIANRIICERKHNNFLKKVRKNVPQK